MNILKKIRGLFNRTSKNEDTPKQLESSKISLIDTSTLQIDENLSDLEEIELKKLIDEIKNGNISTLITYGNDIAKTINNYMEITRKRINQNIEENNSLIKLNSTEEIINMKLKIIFNNAEIDNILSELKTLSRECEIRVLALRKVGEEELRKSKKRINIFSNKYDFTRVDSINNAISRLSSSIKIISMLINSIKMEQYNSKIENETINRFLENNNSEENKDITNKVLNNTFDRLRESLNVITEISGESKILINNIQIDDINFNRESINSKIDIIAQAKRCLDLYVEKNKKDFFKEGGIFSKVSCNLDKLRNEIESDYFDLDLWAKKLYYTNTKEGEGKYYEALQSIEKIISVFYEEIPEEFKEKYYRTKFYNKALCLETRDNDNLDLINTDISETEKRYYSKFLSEIIEKIYKESKDGKLLKFMDKYLGIKDIDKILTDYKRFVALLRIEKYGRDGLFTMILYDHKNQRSDQSYHKDFMCRALDMEDIKKFNSIENDKMFFLKDDTTLQQLYGTSNHFSLDILKLWCNTDHTNRFNCFFADYDNRQTDDWWEDNHSICFKKDFITPREILRLGFYEARKNNNLKLIAEFSRRINNKVRKELIKPEEERLWNSNTIFLNSIPYSLAEFLAGYSLGFERNYRGTTNAFVMDKLLKFKMVRTDENGNLIISILGEEAKNLKTNDINQIGNFLALATSLEYYSDYYRGALVAYKDGKISKFDIFDKRLREFYDNLGKNILSNFLEIENCKKEDFPLDVGYINFFENTRKKLKDKIKKYENKPESEKLWNTEFLDFTSETIGLAELVTVFSSYIEILTSGEISKESVRDSILNYYIMKKDGDLFHIVKNESENGQTLNLKNDPNSIYEIIPFLVRNMLVLETDFNNINDEKKEIIELLSNYIKNIIVENEQSICRKESTNIPSISSRKDYLLLLFSFLSNKGMGKVFKFPQKMIDSISIVSKNKNGSTEYYLPNIPLVVAMTFMGISGDNTNIIHLNQEEFDK